MHITNLKQVNTLEDLKKFIYYAYTQEFKNYQQINQIIQKRFPSSTTLKILKVLEEFDVKRCSQLEKCISSKGCIQRRSKDFKKMKSRWDGIDNLCILCKHFKTNYKKCNNIDKIHMTNFQNLESIQEKEKYIIINLIYEGYSYRKIQAITLMSIQDIVKISKKYNIKYCINGNSCKNLNGPILTYSEFYKNIRKSDGHDSECQICFGFKNAYNKTDNQKRKQMICYFNLFLQKDRENYLEYLYTKKHYSYRDLYTISLIEPQKIIKIFEKKDIKRCANKENCVHINGPIQSRNNFYKTKYQPDGLDSYCIDCQKQHTINTAKSRKEYTKRRNIEFAKFELFAEKLETYQNVRKDPKNKELIQVQCKTCKSWFNPTYLAIQMRINAINGTFSKGSECNLYCSNQCKNNCPLFNRHASELITEQRLANGNFKKSDFKRIQTELRRFKIIMDGVPTHCESCGVKKDLTELYLHHIYPVSICNIFEADLDNMYWYCKNCHEKAHSKDGCKMHELKDFKEHNLIGGI